VALKLLRRARDAQIRQRNFVTATTADIRIAELTAEAGEVEGAIETGRGPVDRPFDNGDVSARRCDRRVGGVTAMSGIGHRHAGSGAVIERLSAVPPNPGFVLNEIPLLRMCALLAQTLGDETAYRDYRYEGDMEWAEAMP